MKLSDKIKQLEKELREARNEIQEDREIKNRLKEEYKSLEETNKTLNRSRMALWQGLESERLELVSRIRRIEMRQECLISRRED